MSSKFVDINELDYKQRDRLDVYLKKLVSDNGSDLHFKSGSVVRGRFNGKIKPMSDEIFSQKDGLTLAKELLRTRFDELIEKKSVDFTYTINKDYRFRVNIFFQMDGVSAVFRTIPKILPTIENLGLPPVVKDICDNIKRGIILVTGATGSGKTTTLASIINRINKQDNSHIITIEDPIEFVYKDDKCIVNQRSIGQDATSFKDALRAALREDPDVILVGEMRDLETIEIAINAAETGHLVLSTLHTLDAKETINRVISMFPIEEQERIRMSFASVLGAIISQRLIPTTDEKRVAAVEILINNHRVKEKILDKKDQEIYDVIKESKNTLGMQTFDQHLLDLFNAGVITEESALENSTKRDNLKILLKNAKLAKVNTSLYTNDKESIKDIYEKAGYSLPKIKSISDDDED
ncbi:PilT/PilU family type 4a pilus ATPase [Campylobacter sp. RM12327]|uniref:type IV pilus twitching motility protein PilT n=1 Tax=Campylobacter sputorum TaxID=206 RepID=UPI000B772BE9|nr:MULTISPECIES: PilT/PilU family type 4a pilus ATPase [Campylobacter]ASM40569.1 type II/IV secretion system protein, PilT/PilU family [Campylobacter sputorum]MBE7357766.1 PilT/PilU family type 4a pilus ATPase [Campylobacter sp. RM11302]MBF6669044.1 PilT/PilU family type 4a pilus ATPase [Campylobacter sp. RM12327]MBF6673947.1 PilT/PilU family type 4a pilus ATPase [Campylobacter sp. RM13538]MBF6675784.1 PilT/PilU family type 4a pilus ATPase [Campylobacter sp. RM12321]